MKATSEDIKDLLAAADLGLVFTENLFCNQEPATPNDVVTIYDSVGGAINTTLCRGSNYRSGGIQVRVRNTQAQQAWLLINKIMTELHGSANFVQGESLYLIIYCSSGPAFLQIDDHNRAIYVVNFDTQRKEANNEE